jgi:dTDP-glucose pyrophosphorylase
MHTSVLNAPSVDEQVLADCTVVIPAAGKLDESLMTLSAASTAAMVPVNGKPVIYHTLEYLLRVGFRRFVVAVREPGNRLERFVRATFGTRATQLSFVVPAEDRGVGYTLTCCRRYVGGRSALIVLGDTYFRFPATMAFERQTSEVLFKETPDSNRWCVITFDGSRKVTSYTDKGDIKADNGNALIGVYWIHDADHFLDSLQKASSETPVVEISYGLAHYSKRYPLVATRCEDWFDCGHADQLLSSRRRLQQNREFNEIELNELDGTVTKRSRNKSKLIDEIEYLQLLPADLRALFPAVVSSSTTLDAPHLTLEYSGYPTASELLLFANLPLAAWEQIFRHLFHIVQRFHNHARPFDNTDYELMYITKTESRLSQLASQNATCRALVTSESAVRIDGRRCQPLAALWSVAVERLRALGRPADTAVIHGDLCLSNILYDVNSRVCKLIDPRGRFGKSGITGDIKYDVAKLYHSVHGQYDFMVNDLFEVRHTGSDIDVVIACERPRVAELQSIFARVFFGSFDHDEIKLIEATLFLSMCPLHVDAPARQVALLATGLRLLNEALAG